MRAVLTLLTACAAIVPPPPTINHLSPTKHAAFETFVSDIEAAMKSGGIPGGAVAIVENGKLAHVAGIGLRDKRVLSPVTPQTLFRIASISKTVLVVAAMSLVEERKLSLDAKVRDYLPGVTSDATVRQIMNHTSGFADGGDGKCALGPGVLDQWLVGWQKQPAWAPPGAVWNYANPNYTLVAAVLEHVTGQRFEDIVQERVFTPAGMPTATYDPSVAVSREHALMHAKSGIVDVDALDCVILRTAGGVMASAEEFGHFAEFLFAHPSYLQLMTDHLANIRRGLDATYGLGVFMANGAVFHGGGMEGEQTQFRTFPKESLAAIAFFNGDSAPMDTPFKLALAKYRGLPAVPVTFPKPDYAQYQGTYRDPLHDLTAVIAQEGDKLWATFDHGKVHVKNEMEFAGGDTFLVNWPIGDSNQYFRHEATFFPGGYLATRAGVAIAR